MLADAGRVSNPICSVQAMLCDIVRVMHKLIHACMHEHAGEAKHRHLHTRASVPAQGADARALMHSLTLLGTGG